MNAYKEQHTILERLTGHGYCGLDARTKVACLLYGIKSDSLDAVKENIVQDSKLHRDFERCVTFYKDFIKQYSGNQNNESRRVAEVGSHKKENNDVEDRYYSKEKYKKLSTNAKENFGSFARNVHRVEDLKEEVRKETNLTKISESLSKRRRSCSAPSRK